MPSSAIEVRPARPEDVTEIRLLVHRCGLYNPDVDYRDFTPPLFVAVADYNVVGFIHALLGKPTSVILDFAVAPEYEHRGIGRKLLATLEATMTSLGLPTWVAFVADGRPRVQGAIEKWGAKQAATGRSYLKRT